MNFHGENFCSLVSVEFGPIHILLGKIPILKIVSAVTLAFHFLLSQMIDLN